MFTSSVATQLRCGDIFNDDCIVNLLLTVSVKEFWKSTNIWRGYDTPATTIAPHWELGLPEFPSFFWIFNSFWQQQNANFHSQNNIYYNYEQTKRRPVSLLYRCINKLGPSRVRYVKITVVWHIGPTTVVSLAFAERTSSIAKIYARKLTYDSCIPTTPHI